MEVFHLNFILFDHIASMPWQTLFKFGAVLRYNGGLMPVKQILAVCQIVVIMNFLV